MPKKKIIIEHPFWVYKEGYFEPSGIFSTIEEALGHIGEETVYNGGDKWIIFYVIKTGVGYATRKLRILEIDTTLSGD